MDNYNWVFFALTSLTAIVAILLNLYRSSKEDGKWEGSISNRVKTLEDLIGEVREELGKIREDINQIFRAFPPDTVKRTSPIQLTDLGKKVSEETQASPWAKQTAPALTAQNRNKGHYDIQEFCLDYVKKESVLSNEMDRRVKSSAYKNGIDKEQVLRVLAVELRNAIFEQLNMDKDANY